MMVLFSVLTEWKVSGPDPLRSHRIRKMRNPPTATMLATVPRRGDSVSPNTQVTMPQRESPNTGMVTSRTTTTTRPTMASLSPDRFTSRTSYTLGLGCLSTPDPLVEDALDLLRVLLHLPVYDAVLLLQRKLLLFYNRVSTNVSGERWPMDTRRIGSLEVSVVGLGCNNFGRRLDYGATSAVVDAALDAGVTFFDTADVYGGTKSEEYLGRALGRRRDDVVVATKFGSRLDKQRRGARPEYVHRAVEDSLRRLGTDRIDLYQLHIPDPDVPIGETLGALDELVRAGKVREVGCSNFSADQLREAEEATRGGAARFASVQNEYSLLHRAPEQDVLLECERAGLAFIPYFPLANGLLTGKYRRGQDAPEGSRLDSGRGERLLTDRNLTIVEELIEFSGSRGYTILELAFSWLLRRPGVASVIAGAMSPE
jgi:aryl-alcohol dehydrogenase-like predicted oxidoreductase